MNKTYATRRPYIVWHTPTARHYFFEWRPSKKDLKILAEREDIDYEDDIDFSITQFNFEDSYNYGRKLRDK